ncbi:MAG TPA: hypothetical protein VLI94_08990 [Solirubrobacterales bacterium]|nr:hypothetical protein [Solirubrobacterales bacterium]
MRSIEKSVLRAWIIHWGFAILVGLAMVAAICVAWKVKVPPEVPDFALNAAAVYRVEVGAATFLGLYLVAMAFVLALNNRGFSEIGVNGLKAQDINSSAQQDAIAEHERQLEVLWSIVDSTEESEKRNLLSS